MTIFLFFIRISIFIIKFDRKSAKIYKYTHKNSRGTRINCERPLLNLNLNYEKLRYKVTDI